jgi:uncharacterized protein YndB with AHSA1/START domain
MRKLKNKSFFVFLLFITLNSCESPLLQTIKERPKAPVFSNISINRDDVGSDWAVLKFKSVDNASEYRVYYKTETMKNWVSIPRNKKLPDDSELPDDNEQKIVWDFISDDNETELEIRVLNLTPDTWYSFYITAVNDIGRESEKSDEISVYTKLPTPVIKNTEIINHYTVKIEWNPVTGADYYAVYYNNNSSIPDEPRKWEIEETNYTLNTLVENTNFYFWVQAYSGSPSWFYRKNYSDLIRTNRRTQLSSPVLFINENLTTSSSISTYWEAVSGANSYEIRYSVYSPESPNARSWSQKTVNDTTCIVTELEPNTLYVFRIRANSSDNSSLLSEETRAYRTRMEPPSVLVKEVTHEKIVLEWSNKNSSEYTPYFFKYGTSQSELSSKEKLTMTYSNTYDFNSLTENTQYYFSVFARDLSGYDGEEKVFSCFTLLSSPVLFINENLTTSSSISTYWEAVSGANSYEIQYSVYSPDPNVRNWLKKTVNVTTCVITDLEPNTLYVFNIRALNLSGNTTINYSIFSDETMAYRTRMEAPSVSAKVVTSERIVLEWSNKDSSENTPFSFKYGISQSAYLDLITIYSNTYDFNSLTENTRYYFSVSARDLSGYDGEEKVFSCFTLLYKPENLAVTTVSENTVSLSWDEKSGADGYIVEVYDSSSSLVRKTELGNIIRDTSYSVTGLAPNTQYSFALRAVNAAAISVNPANHVEGEPSDRVSALTLLSVPQPVIARQLARSIELSWQPVSGTDFYKIFYSKSNSSETAVQYEPGQAITGVSCTVTGLDTGTDYYFWMQAFSNNGNNSRLSPSVRGSTITSNINIIFDFSNPSDPVLEGMPENIIQATRDSYTITVRTSTAGGTKTEWYLYGVIERHTVGNSFTIDWQLPVGPYELTVVVTKNGIPYSASAQFKVLNTEGY